MVVVLDFGASGSLACALPLLQLARLDAGVPQAETTTTTINRSSLLPGLFDLSMKTKFNILFEISETLISHGG